MERIGFFPVRSREEGGLYLGLGVLRWGLGGGELGFWGVGEREDGGSKV